MKYLRNRVPIIIVVLALLILSVADVYAETKTDDNFGRKLFGDVNHDDVVNIEDVTLIQCHLAETIDFNEEELIQADIDGNHKVSVDDATFVQEILAEFVDGQLFFEGMVYVEKGFPICLNPYCYGYVLGPEFSYDEKESWNKELGDHYFFEFSADPTDEEFEEAAREHIAWHKKRREICNPQIFEDSLQVGNHISESVYNGKTINSITGIFEKHRFLRCDCFTCWRVSDKNHFFDFHYDVAQIEKYGSWSNYGIKHLWCYGTTGQPVTDERIDDIHNIYVYNSDHIDQYEHMIQYKGYCPLCDEYVIDFFCTYQRPAYGSAQEYKSASDIRNELDEHMLWHKDRGDDVKSNGQVFEKRYVYRSLN